MSSTPPYGPPPGSPYGQPYAYGPAPQQNQKALWSMILGICAVVGAFVSFLCCVPFGLLAGIPAVILGPMATKEIDRSQGWQTGDGQAKAGLICGIIGIVLNLLVIALLVVMFATMPSEFWYDDDW